MTEQPDASALSHDPRRTHTHLLLAQTPAAETINIFFQPSFTQVPKSEAGDIEGKRDMRTGAFYELQTTGERSGRVNQWYSA